MNKYHAKKTFCEHCGFTHDSRAEAAFCAEKHIEMRAQGSDIVHIDVFPVVTIGKGIKWKLDFALWHLGAFEDGRNAPYECLIEFIDIKGHLTEAFKLKWKLFRENHCGTLRVLRRKRKGWEEIEP